ncbi:MAG: dihydroneopterin aldolase [Acidimicrobiales bacterium]
MSPGAGATPAPAAGDDRIELRGLRVVGTHGVLPEEKQRAQPFELDLDLVVDLAPAAVTDRLSDAVDYAAVAGAAVAVVAGPRSFELLETLAVAVADVVLAADPQIGAVTVALRKLQPPLPVDIATVGVRITRRR